MSRGINKAILIGNLGSDPEVRATAGGVTVCNIRVATTEQWRDKQTGDKKENTEWHNVVLFGKIGEIAGDYLAKGSRVYIEGRIQTRKWQDQSGQDRYTTEIVAKDMQMLGDASPASQQAPSDRRRNETPPQTHTPPPPSDDDLGDDIPF